MQAPPPSPPESDPGAGDQPAGDPPRPAAPSGPGPAPAYGPPSAPAPAYPVPPPPSSPAYGSPPPGPPPGAGAELQPPGAAPVTGGGAPPPAAYAPPQPGYGGYPPQPPGGWQTGVTSTKPGPAPGLEYAGFWWRLLAYVIDGLILLIPELIVGAIVGVTILANQASADVSAGRIALATLVGVLISAAYFVGFWTSRGQTPGMMVCKLRVLRASDGEAIDMRSALIRFLPLAFTSIRYVGGLIALLIGISTGIDERKQGIHDKLAGTFVVRQPV